MADNFVLDTPVAFVMFNRPECVKKSFAKIREAKPKELFIIADGPREDHPEDIELCKKCRKIVENVDWDCKVYHNYADKNMGCGLRPATGFSWVFENAERAIFLEDDCVPTMSFFRFCQEMLEKYKDDEQIFSVSGMNLEFTSDNGADYYFSRYNNSWGWASWRRVWRMYDYEMKDFPMEETQKKLKDVLKLNQFVKYWRNIFERGYMGQIPSAWDYQFTFLSLTHNGLHIYPQKNLVSYIGFNEQATHVKEADKSARYCWATRYAEEMAFPVKGNPPMEVDPEIEYLRMTECYMRQGDGRAMYGIIHNNADKIEAAENLIIYGAGIKARELLSVLYFMSIDKFSVAVTKTNGEEYFVGNRVLSIDEYASLAEKSLVLVAVSQKYQREVVDNLERLGFYNYLLMV